MPSGHPENYTTLTDVTARMAGPLHFRKHRGGSADCHGVALVLQPRTAQHG